MRTRPLGGLAVSTVGLGCNQFGRKIDEAQTARVVHAAIDAGITFFDTADRYGYGDRPYSGFGQSESFLGRAVKGRRDDVVIATKFGIALTDGPPAPRAGREQVMSACEASLRRLGTDYIDLYLLHRPDPDTPVEETLGALDDLVRQGKVREIGCCNVTAAELAAADDATAVRGGTRVVCVQNEYSLLHRLPEADVLPVCVERGVSFVPYFPLASGLLTGKYRTGGNPPADARLVAFPPYRPHLGLTDENLRLVDALAEFAAMSGRSLVDLAVSWLLSGPAVASVITGATSEQQVRANAVAGQWQLRPDELVQVEQILTDAGATPAGS